MVSHGRRQAEVAFDGERVMGSMEKSGGKIFYGWWIVAGGLLIMATCYTIFVNCTTLFQASVVRDLGISVAQFNAASSIATVVSIFASLVVGKLVDTYSSRIIGSVSVVICAVDLILFSRITALWQLYLICFVAGFAVLAGTRLLVSVLITNWFTKRRGLAVSIALAGSGIGGAILSPIVSYVIQTAGWRPAFVMLGIVCLVVALPIPAIMFRNRPMDKGLEPYGANEEGTGAEEDVYDTAVTVSVGWKVVRKSWAFWLLVTGFVLMGIQNGATIINGISMMTEVTVNGQTVVTGGHPETWAAAVLSFNLVVVIFGKVITGALYDHAGLRRATIFGGTVSFIAFIFYCFPTTDFGPILAQFFFGFGTCMGTIAPPIMAVREYGKKDIGLITGIITAFEMFGAAVGAVVSGIMFDVFLSFNPVWILCMACSAIMTITLLASIPAARRLVQRRQEAGAPELDAEGFEIGAPERA